jgi:hypothetical protein
MVRLRFCFLIVIGLFLCPSTIAQKSLFLPPDRYEAISNEISGDIAFDNLRSLVHYHAPTGGARDFAEEAQWIAARAKEYGLEDVKFIPLPAWQNALGAGGANWSLKGGELWLLLPKKMKLGDVRETPTFVADNSPTADLTADLIDVGEGTSEADYHGKNVSGKIVLAYGPLNRVKELACWQFGAAAMVSYNGGRINPWTDHPDQIPWNRLSAPRPGDKPTPPVFMVSARTGLMLSRWMSGHPPEYGSSPAKPSKDPFQVRLKVDSETTHPGTQGLVEGYIRGTTDHDHAIMLTAHMQEEKTSANDDRSGCANMLEIARALETMIADGRMPRPRKDIRFWWTNENQAELEYFSEHPEESSKIIADLNEDMVGAKLSLDNRTVHVTWAPASRWTFVNDVVEAIVETLVLGNNAYLGPWQNHGWVPFSEPIIAHLGSREPYRAELVPFNYGSDHFAFNTARIAIPGLTWTNMPDEFIHSSDDDLWQMDRTELQRNAVAVAASALYIANLSEGQLPDLAASMDGTAQRRILRDLGHGIELITLAPPEQKSRAYADAVNLLHHAILREITGFQTLEPVAGQASHRWITALVANAWAAEPRGRERIDQWYQAQGGSLPVVMENGPAGSGRVPRNVGSVREYLQRRPQARAQGVLHPIMAFEVLNYVDGKRSVLDIYQAVRAESLSAGEWYYGEVRFEDVAGLLDVAANAGLIEFAASGNSSSR